MTQNTGSNAFFAARDQLLDCAGDPERARAEFSWPDVGPVFNWAHDVFDAIAEGNDATALWITDTEGGELKRSFADMKRRSDQVGHWLQSIGARKGDVAMLMLGNRVELWEIMLAALKIGVVILPTSVVLGVHELADRVERGRVRWIFAAPEDAIKFVDHDGIDGVTTPFEGVVVGGDDASAAQNEALGGRHRFEASHEAPDAPLEKTTTSDDTSIIYFTSGTTSLPKIVEHSHVSYPVGHLTTLSWIGVRPGDVHSVVSAPGWAKHAWSSFFGPWNVGATIFVHNYARFDAAQFAAELDRVGVNTFCAPPTVWRMLIQSKLEHKPRGLRELVSAGEPLNPEVIARIQEWWGLEIRDGFGQTETTCLIGNMAGDPVVPGAMGRPLPGVDAVLVDPITGEETDEGEICLRLGPEDGGRGAVRPTNLMKGYFGNTAATEKAMRDGYYHTGDVAQRGTADDGTTSVLTFVGRTDDIFKASDFKVSPFEVESALIEHEFVAEAAVVGAPDATRLNVTKAYIALAAGVEATAETARAILAHARELPPYMRVRRVEFFELPKTTSGKIRRIELRNREVAAFDAGERITTEWREGDFPGLKG